MKFEEASQLLQKALKEQKTIKIDKLKEILMAMNISAKKDAENTEIEYLKKELKKAHKEINALKKKIKGE